MTWDCSVARGSILSGLAARLFITAADDLMASIESLEESQEIGSELFSTMPWSVQIVSIGYVCKHLLTKTEMPELSDWSEATIYAIYEHLNGLCEVEEDEGTSSTFRSLVLATSNENDDEPDSKFDDLMVQGLRDRILWDRDFEDTSRFVDLSQESKDEMFELLRINCAYSSTVPPIDSDDEITSAVNLIRDLRGGLVR